MSLRSQVLKDMAAKKSGNKVLPYQIGISGGGPTTIHIVISLVLNYITNQENMTKVSGTPNIPIELTIFEQKSRRFFATGNSIPVTDNACLNTPVWGAHRIQNPEGIPAEHREALSAVLDFRSAVQKFVKEHPDHGDVMEKKNLAARALFNLASKTPEFDMTQACMDRGTLGRLHHESFFSLVDFVKEHVPGIKIDIKPNTTVEDTDFSNRLRPILCVRKNGAKNAEYFPFDFVVLSNGLSSENLLSEEVKPFAFSSTPNTDDMRVYLKQQDVLDHDGMIKPGSKIGITGMGLAAFDYMTILTRFTDLFSPTDDGYALNEENVEKYKDLFTFISRSNRVAPPRITHTGVWAGEKRFYDTTHIHALRLQPDFDWISFIHPILIANVAYELGVHPSEVEVDKPVAEKMEDYITQIQNLESNPNQEIGLLRSAYAALGGSFGLEPSLDNADKVMSILAPLAWKGRGSFFYMMVRAACVQPTTLAAASKSPNSSFTNIWNGLLQPTVAASPLGVFGMVSSLFHHGVARHVHGAIPSIEPRSNINGGANNQTGIGTDTFSALFSAPLFSPRADAVLTSLSPKILEVAPGAPSYSKGRFLQTPQGKRINCIDTGIAGLGTQIRVPGGGTSTVNVRWTDGNCHRGSVDRSDRIADMILLLASIQATGSRDPASILFTHHARALPSATAFRAETLRFLPQWNEIWARRIYLEICTSLATTGADFRALAANTDTVSVHNGTISAFGPPEFQDELQNALLHASIRIPQFTPLDLSAYLDQFPDFTFDELDCMWCVALHKDSPGPLEFHCRCIGGNDMNEPLG
ncbi:hypothetical protein GGR57DRAFT_248028 [Xylariaceae sp. FL1272]|nr:hypothetical protein GGR57DRAFT_248028 [Xylariaceae sp. FL1272]